MKLTAESLMDRGMTVPQQDGVAGALRPVVHVAAPVVHVAAPRVSVEAPNINVAAPTIKVAAPAVTVNVPDAAPPTVVVGMVGGPDIEDLAAAMRELKRDRPKGMTMTVNRDPHSGLILSTKVTFEY